MLRGYWGTILAVVGLALFGVGSTVTYQLYDSSEQRHGSYDYQPASKPGLEYDVRGKPVAQSYQPNCENPQSNENSDLCAQWAAVDQVTESNRMASLNLRFAIVSLWATIIGTALLLWTLIETRKTSRSELRAYLFPDACNVLVGVKVYNKGQAISFIAIKNSGSTPAHKVRHWSEIKIAAATNEGEMISPKSLDGSHQSTIPPGGAITANRLTKAKVTRAEMAAIKNGSFFVFVYGAIEYLDVFDRPHRTDYRLHYSGLWPPPEGATISFCSDGNDAT